MNSKLLCCAVFLTSATALVAGPKLKPIFNGKDLSGWEVPDGNDEAGWYKAVEGVLKIQSGSKKKGSILWSKKKYRNFVVEFEFPHGRGPGWTAACMCEPRIKSRLASAVRSIAT